MDDVTTSEATEDHFGMAIIGWAYKENIRVPVLSYELLMVICMQRDGMTEQEAEEFIEANFIFWYTDAAPIVMFPLFDDDER